LGVGSYNQASYGTKTLNILLHGIEKYDAETRLLDLREVNLPIFDPGASNDSADLKTQKATIEVNWADAFVLASPDYHGSMSGSMKNLDYYWEEFAGKIFGYICTSHEKGLTVMDQMRTAVGQCYGRSLPYGIYVNAEEDFNETGDIINNLLAKPSKHTSPRHCCLWKIN
jgi:azobenzene reductase